MIKQYLTSLSKSEGHLIEVNFKSHGNKSESGASKESHCLFPICEYGFGWWIKRKIKWESEKEAYRNDQGNKVFMLKWKKRSYWFRNKAKTAPSIKSWHFGWNQ